MRHFLLGRTTATLLVGLALATIGGLFFGWLGEEVLENDTVRFDQRAGALIHRESQPDLTQAMIIVTQIGSTLPVAVLSLLAAVSFWLLHMRRQAVVLAIAMMGAAVLSYVLKLGFHRVRPEPYFGLAVPSSFSFPSGHSLVAMCFYGVLAHLVNSRVQHGLFRAAIWAFAAVMVLLIGFSRIYLGVHYASDVIAGYAAGVVWVLAIVLVERPMRPFRSPGPEHDTSGTIR